MSDNKEMSVTQKRALRNAEWQHKFGKYWFVYMALLGTATLSAISGILLPFKPSADGFVTISWGLVFAALYYSIGFLTTGEGAAYFWFEKITDQDEDNTTQKIVAYGMLAVAIGTSLVTALAAGALIAFWLGVFDTFVEIPSWAQKWVVWAIPTMWVLHFIAGTIFKAASEEAEYERQSRSIINKARNEMTRAKEQARANWWTANAPEIARQMGEMEAQDELDAYKAKIDEQKSKRQPSMQLAKDVRQHEVVSDNGADPTKRRS